DAILLWSILLLPFLGSLCIAFLPSDARNAAGAIAGGVALTGTALAVLLYSSVSGGEAVRTKVEWLPSLGLDLFLRLDGISWLFAFIVLAIGFLVVLYARYYMSPEDPVPRFFSFFLAFMGAMLGL